MKRDELLKLAEKVSEKQLDVAGFSIMNSGGDPELRIKLDAMHMVARDELAEAQRVYQAGLRQYLDTPEAER